MPTVKATSNVASKSFGASVQTKSSESFSIDSSKITHSSANITATNVSAAIEEVATQVAVNTSAPSSPSEGDLWYDSDDNIFYLRVDSAWKNVVVADLLDQDNMSSNSATAVATQQSVKAYVDAQITGEDLDIQGDSGGALSIDLNSETLTLTGGTGIDTAGSSNTITFSLDLNELSTETSIASGDFISMVDITDNGSGKITLANFQGYLTGTGALNSGSITNGFGTIDIGSSALTAGATQVSSLSVLDGSITNVADINCDSISIDDAAVGLNIDFGGNTTLNKVTLTDNLADALNITESSNSYLKFVTSNSGEKITLGKKLEAGSVEIEGSAFDIDGGTIDGTDVTVGSGKTLDVSAGTLTLASDQISGDKVSGGTIGTTTITALAGALSLGDNNITNVSDIALDSISADGTDINVAVSDNSATAFTIKQGSDSYLVIDTANSSESVAIGTGISGTGITIGHSTSETTVADNLTVTGDLKVNGDTVTQNVATMTINDPIISLQTADDGANLGSDSNKDVGLAMFYHTGSAPKTAFLGWDDSAGKLTFVPDASISSEVVSGSVGTIVANLEGDVTGNVTGNASGTAATVTGASQSNITSLGTLTALAVDNITINGNDISSTSGTDLTITPLSGQQIVLDGTIVVDAGVVTGATSITSTAFVGDITGDVTGTADLATSFTASANNSADETVYPVFVDGATGTQGAETDTGLTYNPSSGLLTATAFSGNITGNVTGNTSGTAATVTTAAQSNITSLGTLTALTIDDVAIDGKVMTMTGSSSDTAVFTAGTNGTLSIVTTDAAAAAANIQITADGTVDIDSAGVLTLDSGAAINIEPATGSAILLDGTVSVDAGVITGATSITSTAFVGTLSTASQTNITGVGTIGTGVWEATDVAVAHGGTGASTLTANGVLIGNGTSAVTAVDLTAQGKILIGDGSGNPQALTLGSNDDVLTADSSTATGVKWASLASAAISTSSNGGGSGVDNSILLYNGTANTSVDSNANLTFDGTTLGLGSAAGSGVDAKFYTAGTAAHVGLHWDADLATEGTLLGGVDDHGVDLKFHGETAGAFVHWDMSDDLLEVRGGAATAGILKLTTAETSVVNGNELGRINFQAPIDGAGTDAILVGASIHALAVDTFAANLNKTDLVFSTANSEAASERFRIYGEHGKAKFTNAVGIGVVAGTTSEGATSTTKLQVRGDGSNEALMTIENVSSHAAGIELLSGHGNWGVYNSDTVADALELRDDSAGATRLLIDSSGNVGIANTSPSNPLDVTGLIAATGLTVTAGETIATFQRNGADAAGADEAFIATAVDSFDADAAHNYALYGVAGSTTDRSSSFFIKTRQHPNTGFYALRSNSGGSIYFNNGNSTAHDNSDERLKKNISTISDALNKVKALRGVRFQWKEEHERFKSGHARHQMSHYGLIAQEVEKIVPEFVAQGSAYEINEETGEWGDETEVGCYKAVQDANEIPSLLIEAIKELTSKVETLEAKVTTLENG